MKKAEQSETTTRRSKRKSRGIPEFFCDDDINFGRAAKTGFWDTDLMYDDDYVMKD